MMSDVCKHCVEAPCLEVCPTGAIIRTEFDTVVIQSDTCNGCRACIAACPFGVIGINDVSNTAQKCTLCYDRLQAGMEPACSQACPTDSIRFGTIQELKEGRSPRAATAPAGREPGPSLRRGRQVPRRTQLVLSAGGQARSLRLPAHPKMPTRNLIPASLFSTAGALVLGATWNGRLEEAADGRRSERRRAGGGGRRCLTPSSPPRPTGPGGSSSTSSWVGSPAARSSWRPCSTCPAVRAGPPPLARLGYYVAFVGVVISGFLLTIDLTRPLRFWHMLIQNQHRRADVQAVGADVGRSPGDCFCLGLFSFLAALAALSEERRGPGCSSRRRCDSSGGGHRRW